MAKEVKLCGGSGLSSYKSAKINVGASELARRYAAFRGFLGKMLLTFRKFGTILKIQ
jgi:hypothetical protein